MINQTVFRKVAYWLPHYVERFVRASLSDGLSRAYGLGNPRLRRLSLPAVQQVNQVADLFLSAGRGSTTILSGAEVNSGLPLKVALVGIWETGQRNSLPHFEHLLFGEGPVRREPAGNFSLWKMRDRAESLAGQVDLMLILGNSLVVRPPARGSWTQGAVELRMAFDYHAGESWKQIEQRMKGQRENLRHIRREGYTCRVSRSAADFELFYHDYYVPMVKTRYKEYGDINTENGLRKLFCEKGELLFVLDAQGSPVSAGLHTNNHGVMYSLLFGVRGGDRELVHKGALAAMYYYSLQHGFERGCRRHDAGVCLPFLSDGVLRHKLTWGYEALPNPWRPWGLLLWAPRSAPAALEWMRANPFLPPFGKQR